MTKFKWKILGKRDNNHYISMANNDEAKLYFAGFKNGIVLSQYFSGKYIATFDNIITDAEKQADPKLELVVFKIITLDRYFGALFIACSYDKAIDGTGRIQLMKIADNSLSTSVVSVYTFKMKDYYDNWTNIQAPYNSFDVLYIQDTFQYVMYAKGGTHFEVRDLLDPDQKVLQKYTLGTRRIGSITISGFNPNLIIIALSKESSKKDTWTNTYQLLTFMPFPCIETESLSSGCTFKHISCKTCTTDYKPEKVDPDNAAKFIHACQYLKDNKFCIDGYFEIEKKCYYNCVLQRQLYGDYINNKCISADEICQNQVPVILSSVSFPFITNSVFLEIGTTKTLWQIYCESSKIIGYDYSTKASIEKEITLGTTNDEHSEIQKAPDANNILVTYRGKLAYDIMQFKEDSNKPGKYVFEKSTNSRSVLEAYENIHWFDSYILLLVGTQNDSYLYNAKTQTKYQIQALPGHCIVNDVINERVYSSMIDTDDKQYIGVYSGILSDPSKPVLVNKHEIVIGNEECRGSSCYQRSCQVVYSMGRNGDAIYMVEYYKPLAKYSWIAVYNIQLADSQAPELLFSYNVLPVVESWLFDVTNDYLYISESTGFIYQFDISEPDQTKQKLVQEMSTTGRIYSINQYPQYPNTILLSSNDKAKQFVIQRSFVSCKQSSCVKATGLCIECLPDFLELNNPQLTTNGVLLAGKQCMRACAEGYYVASTECKGCDSVCKKCKDSATNCMGCSDVTSLQSLAVVNTCIGVCPVGESRTMTAYVVEIKSRPWHCLNLVKRCVMPFADISFITVMDLAILRQTLDSVKNLWTLYLNAQKLIPIDITKANPFSSGSIIYISYEYYSFQTLSQKNIMIVIKIFTTFTIYLPVLKDVSQPLMGYNELYETQVLNMEIMKYDMKTQMMTGSVLKTADNNPFIGLICLTASMPQYLAEKDVIILSCEGKDSIKKSREYDIIKHSFSDISGGYLGSGRISAINPVEKKYAIHNAKHVEDNTQTYKFEIFLIATYEIIKIVKPDPVTSHIQCAGLEKSESLYFFVCAQDNGWIYYYKFNPVPADQLNVIPEVEPTYDRLTGNTFRYDGTFHFNGVFPLMVESYLDQNDQQILVIVNALPNPGDDECQIACYVQVTFVEQSIDITDKLIKDTKVLQTFKVPMQVNVKDIKVIKHTDVIYLSSHNPDITIQYSRLAGSLTDADSKQEKDNYEMFIWNERMDVVPMLSTTSGEITEISTDDRYKFQQSAVLLQKYNSQQYYVHNPIARSSSTDNPCSVDDDKKPERIKMTSCGENTFLAKDQGFCIGRCPQGFREKEITDQKYKECFYGIPQYFNVTNTVYISKFKIENELGWGSLFNYYSLDKFKQFFQFEIIGVASDQYTTSLERQDDKTIIFNLELDNTVEIIKQVSNLIFKITANVDNGDFKEKYFLPEEEFIYIPYKNTQICKEEQYRKTDGYCEDRYIYKPDIVQVSGYEFYYEVDIGLNTNHDDDSIIWEDLLTYYMDRKNWKDQIKIHFYKDGSDQTTEVEKNIDCSTEISKYNKTETKQKFVMNPIFKLKQDKQPFDLSDYELQFKFKISDQFTKEQENKLVQDKNQKFKCPIFQVCHFTTQYYDKEEKKCLERKVIKFLLTQTQIAGILKIYCEIDDSQHFSKYFFKDSDMLKTLEIQDKVHKQHYTWSLTQKDVFQGLVVGEFIIDAQDDMLGSLIATIQVFSNDYIQMISDFRLNRQVLSLSLTDIWKLDQDTLDKIDTVVKSLGKAKTIATISAFSSNFLAGGSISVAQVMMIMGMVNVLKYIPLNWPPNVIKQFTVKQVNLDYMFPFTFDDSVYQLQAFPPKYASYEVSSLFLNNYGEKLSQFFFYYFIGTSFKLFSHKIILIKNITLQIIVQFLYQLFAYNYVIFFFMENFINIYINIVLVLYNTFFLENQSFSLLFNNAAAIVTSVLLITFSFHMFYTARTCIKILKIFALQQKQQEQIETINRIKKRISLKRQFQWDNFTSSQKREQDKSKFFSEDALNEVDNMFGMNLVTNENIEAFHLSQEKFMQVKLIDRFYKIEGNENRVRFLSNYNILHADYRKDKIIYSFYFLFDLMRLVLVGNVIVFMYDSPMIATYIIASIILLYVLILIKYFPYKDKITAGFVIFTEIMIIVLVFSIAYLAYLDYVKIFDNKDQRLAIGFIILFLTQILIYLASISNLYIVFKQGKKLYASFKQNKNNQFLANNKEAADELYEKERIIRETAEAKMEIINIYNKGMMNDDELEEKLMDERFKTTKKQIKQLQKYCREKKGIYLQDDDETSNEDEDDSDENTTEEQSEDFKNRMGESEMISQYSTNNQNSQRKQKIKSNKQNKNKGDNSVNSITEDERSHFQMKDESALMINQNESQVILDMDLLEKKQKSNSKKGNNKPINAKEKNNKKEQVKKVEVVEVIEVIEEPKQPAKKKTEVQLQLEKAEKKKAYLKQLAAEKKQARYLARLALKNRKVEVKVYTDFTSQIREMQQELQTMIDNKARQVDINNMKRKIQVYENRSILGLNDMDDEEFIALANDPSMARTVIQQAELSQLFKK